ncbi:hypothetical protein IJG90_02605 [Candidatus Saccharibacteria bacterium]|nr:hypothetical protein [Candidatus Saccharibacteria bacterium]
MDKQNEFAHGDDGRDKKQYGAVITFSVMGVVILALVIANIVTMLIKREDKQSRADTEAVATLEQREVNCDTIVSEKIKFSNGEGGYESVDLLKTEGDYVCIDEWDVKIELTNEIQSLEYVLGVNGGVMFYAATIDDVRTTRPNILPETIYTGLATVERIPKFAFTADNCQEVFDSGYPGCYISVGTEDVVYEQDDYYFYANSAVPTWAPGIMQLYNADADDVETVSEVAKAAYAMISDEKNWSRLSK